MQNDVCKQILGDSFQTLQPHPCQRSMVQQSNITTFFSKSRHASKRTYSEREGLQDSRKLAKDALAGAAKQEVQADCSVPGLTVIPDFVSEQEEEQLLGFLADQCWRTDLARRVIHYGGTYCLMPPRNATPAERKEIENTILTADPIPDAMSFLISRFMHKDIYKQNSKPEFCIVNEYTGNQGISAHVENFRFDEPVCGLTLGDGDWMRFRELTKPHDGSVRSGKAAQAEKTGRKEDIWLPSRSLVVMKDASRYQWQHEIVRSQRGRSKPGWKRTSLTFRVLRVTK